MSQRTARPLVTLLLAVTLVLATALAIDGAGAAGADTEPLVAINAGGTAVTTDSGITFDADTLSPTAPVRFTGGRSFAILETVGGTPDPALYQTVRSGSSFGFIASGLDPSSYDITLGFVEPTAARSGDRLFDVTVEGATVLDDFDILAAAGARLVAHTETITTDVLDGELDVFFVAETGRPVIASIAVRVAADAPRGTVTFSPLSIDFGGVVTGATPTADVTVTNDTAHDVALMSANVDDDAFTVTSPALPVTIPPAGTSELTVAFSPRAVAAHAGTLVVATSDPATPTLTVHLSGQGISADAAPDIGVDASSLDFGNAVIGQNVARTLTITSGGGADLLVSDLVTTGEGYEVSASLPMTIASDASSELIITFSPTQAGDGGGELVIVSNDPDEPELTIPLIAAVASFSPGSVAVVGCSNTQQHASGYLDASSLDQLAAVHNLGGGSLPVWASGSAEYWSVYEALRPEGGYEAAWVQICLRAHEIGEDNEAELTTVVEEIAARDGDIPVIVSPLNLYVEGHECESTGADSPAVAAELADFAADALDAVRGPDTGPLASEQLRRDGCHLNDAGLELVGAQLLAFFDPM
jgi:hypothetical protein